VGGFVGRAALCEKKAGARPYNETRQEEQRVDEGKKKWGE